MPNLHGANLQWDGAPDPETDELVRDLLKVWNSVHQGMVVYGPWFEARILNTIRRWLPAGFGVSGPSQIFDPEHPGIRSRSWDIVIHRYPLAGLPPESAPGNGYPLLPRESVAAVIDTKTNFATPGKYASGPVFNLMNDAALAQSEFLGARVSKMLLIATSSRSPDAMANEGERHGILTFSLGRYMASPVADGDGRQLLWRMQAYRDGRYPFQEFKFAVLRAVSSFTGS